MHEDVSFIYKVECAAVERLKSVSFKGKYFILGAIGVIGLIFTDGWIQLLFGIYTAGCVIGAIKGDS